MSHLMTKFRLAKIPLRECVELHHQQNQERLVSLMFKMWPRFIISCDSAMSLVLCFHGCVDGRQ
jgi:hypothetical protein